MRPTNLVNPSCVTEHRGSVYTAKGSWRQNQAEANGSEPRSMSPYAMEVGELCASVLMNDWRNLWRLGRIEFAMRPLAPRTVSIH